MLSIALIAAVQAGAMAQVPGYIKATSKATTKAFGTEIAGKIFSDELTPLRQEAVTRSARMIPGFECPADLRIALIDVVPYPVKPATVSWIEGFIVDCNPRARRSFLLLLDGERVRIAELLPGSTATDPLLQRDASHGAKVIAKRALPPECAKAILIDTQPVDPLRQPGRPWREFWTFDLCGGRVDVEMTFTPSSRGGTKWAARIAK